MLSADERLPEGLLIGVSGLARPSPLAPSDLVACERSHERLRHVAGHRLSTARPDPSIFLGLIENGCYGGITSDGDVTVAVAGWIEGLGNEDLRDDAAVLLAQYRRNGIEAVAEANGAFFAVIVDRGRRRVFLVTDRHGLRPHYYWTDGQCLAWGSEIKFIMGLPFVPMRTDAIAITEYFRFQTMLGDRTFFEGVHVVPQASWIEYDLETGWSSARRYSGYQDTSDGEPVSYEQAVQTTAGLFEQAMYRALAKKVRYGALLSGGLDSRLLADLASRGSRSLDTFTFGVPGCRDQIYGAQIARAIGSRHTPLHWHNGYWLREVAAMHTALTESFHNLFHSHGLSFASLMAERIDVNLSGYFGDVVMGGSFLLTDVLQRRGDWDHAEERLHAFCRDYHGHSVRDEAGEASLFEADFLASRTMGVRESFHENFRMVRTARFENAIDYFHIANRARRMIVYFLVFSRPYFESRTPFFDQDLLNYLYSLPPEYRINRRLQIDVSDLLGERSMQIPWQRTGKLPTRKPSLKKLCADARMEIGWRLERLTGGRLGPPRHAYADYTGWSRGDLRPWIEEVLLSPHSATRGIFREAGVRECWRTHLANESDATYIIGMLLSIELLMRQVSELRRDLLQTA